MTQAEFNKIDIRYLSEEAARVVEQSDQSLYDYVKDINADDFDALNERLAGLFDEC